MFPELPVGILSYSTMNPFDRRFLSTGYELLVPAFGAPLMDILAIRLGSLDYVSQFSISNIRWGYPSGAPRPGDYIRAPLSSSFAAFVLFVVCFGTRSGAYLVFCVAWLEMLSSTTAQLLKCGDSPDAGLVLTVTDFHCFVHHDN